MASRPVQAVVYQPGDGIDDFVLTDRATRKPVRLSDLQGKIVFLEWFAWWCPFCQASAPQVEAGIVEWYASRGGNPAGIPVLHVAINLQPNQEAQTQNFVTRAGFGLVLEDFNRALANRFQSGGQPIFAIINGVTNSTSHKPWELLLHQDGYGQRDFTESITRFRAVIDQVKPGRAVEPPVVIQGPLGATLTAGESWQPFVVATGEGPLAWQWSRDGQAIPGATNAHWVLSPVTLADSGAYTVRISNAGGSVVSEPVTLIVQPRIPLAARLGLVSREPDGMISLVVVGAEGAAPKLEFSTDLVHWRAILDLQAGAASQRVVVSPGEGIEGFFRVRND